MADSALSEVPAPEHHAKRSRWEDLDVDGMLEFLGELLVLVLESFAA